VRVTQNNKETKPCNTRVCVGDCVAVNEIVLVPVAEWLGVFVPLELWLLVPLPVCVPLTLAVPDAANRGNKQQASRQ
jgi:hypothetical protein